MLTFYLFNIRKAREWLQHPALWRFCAIPSTDDTTKQFLSATKAFSDTMANSDAGQRISFSRYDIAFRRGTWYRVLLKEVDKMESYEEIVMQAVSQLMVKAMAEQRISDEKVSAATDELVEISQRVMATPLDAETRAMLDRYLSLTHMLEGLREEHLYVQGAKDCVRLLKELGVLA